LFQSLDGRIEHRLIVPLDGLDSIVTGVALRSGPRCRRVDTPRDEADQAKREIDVSEEAGIDLSGQKFSTALPILRPVLEVADYSFGHFHTSR